MERVMLARAWRISPETLRRCTYEEINAMKTLLAVEVEQRGR